MLKHNWIMPWLLMRDADGPMNLTICDTFDLTHWIRGKFATILLMNFSIGFENALFWFEFSRIVLLRVQLVISKRCFMLWLSAEKEKVITLANDFPTKWRIYASRRLKDSTENTCILVSALINKYHNLTLYFFPVFSSSIENYPTCK